MDFIDSMALSGGNPAIAAAMRTAANKKRPKNVKPIPVKPAVPSDSSKKESK